MTGKLSVQSGSNYAWRPPSWALGVALACAFLAWQVTIFYPFMADDAFISLRYSQRLLEGHGLTWSQGETVEGYSNLTWVLLCAGLGSLGIDLVWAARILGVGCTGASLAALALAFRPGRFSGWPLAAAVWTVAACSPIAVWAVGGLEQPLVACAAAGLVVTVGYRDRFVSLPAGAPHAIAAFLTLSRPDGILVCALACAGLLAAQGVARVNVLRAARLFSASALALLAQVAFRLWYYDDWIPNPARIKLAFSAERAMLGWSYVSDAAASLAPVFLALVWGAWCIAVNRRRSTGLAVSTFVAWGWLAYVVFVGGDIFPARRHIVLPIVMAAFIVGELAQAASRVLPSKTLSGVVAGFVAVLAVGQSRDFQAEVARAERWEWDGEVIGRLLGKAFGEKRALLAVDPAGCLPYFSGLPAIDMLGLNDRHIARNPPPDLGKGKLAHEFGDGRYVLSRRPDLALFCLPQGSERACFRSAAEMLGQAEFHRDYRLLTFEGDRPHLFRSRVWVNVYSSVIGMTHEAGEIIIPGYLFADSESNVARLDDRGALVMKSNGAPAHLRKVHVPAGWYSLKIEGEGSFALSVKGATLSTTAGELRLQVTRANASLDFTLTSDGPGELHSVTMTFAQ